MKTIGFIGLGIMGKPMAENLLKAGYSLMVYNRSKSVVNEMVALGAKAGKSPADVAAQSELLLTMLPNSPEVREVLLGENGVINAVHSQMIVIDMSSIAPLEARAIAEEFVRHGVPMLDAPVSGGEEKAQSGQLAFMIGGDTRALEKCRPVLEVMGASITHVGDTGAGNIAKLVNQSIVAVNIAVIAEALSLGKRLGVDPARIVAAITGGLAGSSCLNDKAPRMLCGNYQPGFKLKLHAKDLDNVLDTAEQANVQMPLTSKVMTMIQELIAAGNAELDHGGLALHYEKINQLSLSQESNTNE